MLNQCTLNISSQDLFFESGKFSEYSFVSFVFHDLTYFTNFNDANLKEVC